MSVEKEKSLFHLFPLALFRDKIDITEPERKILINEILSQEKNSKTQSIKVHNLHGQEIHRDMN